MPDERKISGNILFKEEQKFRVQWIWWLLLVCVFSSFALSVGIPLADKQGWKTSSAGLLILVPVETLVLYLFYVVKLETIISNEGVYYRWRPFFKRYSFIDRTQIEVTKADDGPLWSYGFHFIPGYGRVNNMGPGKGMRFKLKNGKRIFIGTNNINAFQAAVDKMMKG